ncbi:RNA methyltransferase [Undibacterium oligocarboniphilum]|uniref:tRNA (cytidine/uridine-2'-O-)-methyltransferase TrmJ n=1 Tax=Undibacterium oligocarboniphilum TaxID=666702 RepID=A0A850Q8R1_9BURK|nr:RNA methyltransferase [Undibacterium oligocarboniphilum]MBC3868682.1 RNA methyltransferase [Undibacterium oligocarboniphilum]NVO76662.1 RNA methyltransferase [Undibacterium oligocarboniphilum]
MNLTQTDTSLFNRLRFVLVETSHPGNVGAAARALKTMGFSQLYLVRPRFADVLKHPEAIAFASGAQDILDNARIVDTVEEALIGCDLVAAVSARLREFSPPLITPRELANQAAGNLVNAALVFGSERYGLPNEVVMNCQWLIHIPANPEYSSLNLAQAVQLLAYEGRMAAGQNPISDAEKNVQIGFRGQLATSDMLDGMYAHLEQALIKIDFLHPDQPKKLMPRLKRLFSRTQLETEEVNILRGIAKKIMDMPSK